MKEFLEDIFYRGEDKLTNDYQSIDTEITNYCIGKEKEYDKNEKDMKVFFDKSDKILQEIDTITEFQKKLQTYREYEDDDYVTEKEKIVFLKSIENFISNIK